MAARAHWFADEDVDEGADASDSDVAPAADTDS